MNLSHPLTEYAAAPGRSTAGTWIERVNSEFPSLRLGGIDRDFRACYRGAATSDLQISDIEASRHTIFRPAQRTDDGTNLFKISYQLQGTGTIRQGQHELRFSPGTITLYDAAQPYEIEFENNMRFIVAMFPKSALRIPSGIAGELRARQLDADDVTSRGLGVLFTRLAENLPLLGASAGEQLGKVAIDIVNSLLSERIDDSNGDGLRHVRREALAYIDVHLADPELSPRSIAAALFVSVRRLHTAFEDTGTTIAKWIRERRLSECRRALGDPINASEPIQELAQRFGFDDMSLFSRRFRERFGVTPSEFRHDRDRHEVRIGMH